MTSPVHHSDASAKPDSPAKPESGSTCHVAASPADPASPDSNDARSGTLSTRSIRSFVVRNGRMTTAQSAAMGTLLPRYGLPFSSAPLDPAAVFGREAPLWVEVGFGNGDALVHMATSHPDVNFLGIEVHAPGVGHALRHVEESALLNVRIVQHDALDVLEHMLATASVDLVALYFPDPWHKKRHHKRRIVQDVFINQVCRVLKPGALLHCATDWADYANWMLEHLDAAPGLDNAALPGPYAERPAWRASTRFERRGQRLGHDVFDLLYRRGPE